MEDHDRHDNNDMWLTTCLAGVSTPAGHGIFIKVFTHIIIRPLTSLMYATGSTVASQLYNAKLLAINYVSYK